MSKENILQNVITACQTSKDFYTNNANATDHPQLQEWMLKQANIRARIVDELTTQPSDVVFKYSLDGLHISEKDVGALNVSYSVAKQAMLQQSMDACLPHIGRAEKILTDMLNETAKLTEKDDLQDLLRSKAMRIEADCNQWSVEEQSTH